MRTEQEMYHLILETANQDERILAVYMNGSRTNVNVPEDIFQDFDIVFVVNETASFINDKIWIRRFGEILYMQYPEESPYYPSDKENFYGWLIQCDDGNRIDLHVETVKHAQEHIGDDKLCRILLDKKAILPDVHESTDRDYWIKKPTNEQYLNVCNEFWWCLNNVAKGLWREEITYVQDMVNFHVRKQLEKMLSWKVGILTDFSVSIGKSGKYMYRWIDKQEWETYLSTYFTGRVSESWEAVMTMCNLFEQTALYVGELLEFKYNEIEGKNARGFLEHVRFLPKDAKGIY
ncbi:aminoglycoside 6-adenylyltransferase [Anaerosacchariphilus polymeriproducens]|uniref:Aminoglycoside 6-adenylyltransferase n=1 Tax=Anaerosacchariphilus polymeriproducens TaxID=1812858 RepID=A0A371AVS1_9FIRM|nr:aminoglycoside 6-adenylyltransferase [Anaerosacchariphilus polymeriproducens]RDU23668.1 aminoglycoside 6-adenylyltransferase [Anaerosacchariphilus polymeriproducens]